MHIFSECILIYFMPYFPALVYDPTTTKNFNKLSRMGDSTVYVNQPRWICRERPMCLYDPLGVDVPLNFDITHSLTNVPKGCNSFPPSSRPPPPQSSGRPKSSTPRISLFPLSLTATNTYTPTTCSRWYDHEWLKADYKPDSSIHLTAINRTSGRPKSSSVRGGKGVHMVYGISIAQKKKSHTPSLHLWMKLAGRQRPYTVTHDEWQCLCCAADTLNSQLLWEEGGGGYIRVIWVCLCIWNFFIKHTGRCCCIFQFQSKSI